LIAPNSTHRPTERSRYVRLLGETRVYQEDHRIGLSHRVFGAIVMTWQSSDDDDALIRFRPQAAARIDDDGVEPARAAANLVLALILSGGLNSNLN